MSGKHHEIVVGNFILEVTEEHPVWIRITHNGRQCLTSIHHAELPDLAYVVKRAQILAKDNLSRQSDKDLVSD